MYCLLKQPIAQIYSFFIPAFPSPHQFLVRSMFKHLLWCSFCSHRIITVIITLSIGDINWLIIHSVLYFM